eukprot:3198751-Rhodomonas_salina.1
MRDGSAGDEIQLYCKGGPNPEIGRDIGVGPEGAHGPCPLRTDACDGSLSVRAQAFRSMAANHAGAVALDHSGTVALARALCRPVSANNSF